MVSQSQAFRIGLAGVFWLEAAHEVAGMLLVVHSSASLTGAGGSTYRWAHSCGWPVGADIGERPQFITVWASPRVLQSPHSIVTSFPQSR